LKIGEQAYEGVIQCNLRSKNMGSHHVRSLVMWKDASRQKLTCIHIFAWHGHKVRSVCFSSL